MPEVRPGREDDLPALVAIYNHYVETSPVTFDVEPYTVETRRGWFDAYDAQGRHRLLVIEDAGEVVAYATSSPFRPKAAYDRSVETTVYVSPDHLGRGLGRLVYGALIEELRRRPDVHRAIAGITVPNPDSERLHRDLGFEDVGTFTEVGFKFGRYWDVRWFELDLGSSS